MINKMNILMKLILHFLKHLMSRILIEQGLEKIIIKKKWE